jgi:N-acetylmuramoyl-L-alanine amidase
MKRKIDYIVIHCTATSQDANVSSIQRYWKDVLKWKSPGYHILIEADGTRNYLQPFDRPANGVRGFNQNSIHISYIGGIDAQGKAIDNRTEAQKKSIITAIKSAIVWSENGNVIIQGHRDFSNVKKDCPSFNAKNEYKDL